MAARTESQESGYSLIELLVVIVILGVVSTITLSTILTSMRNQESQVEHVNALNTAKIGLERLTRDVRHANPITAGDPSTIEMQITEAGTTRTESWRVTTVSGETALVRCAGPLVGCTAAGGQVMTSGLSSAPGTPLFTYFDDSGVEIAAAGGVLASDLDLVRAIEVTMRVPRRDFPEVELSNLVQIRNAGD